jgi:hypothetical protein
MEMTEEQKKEAKAAKAAGSKADRHGAGAKGSSDLVVVNMTCSAPDKVVVSFDFPALSAPA